MKSYVNFYLSWKLQLSPPRDSLHSWAATQNTA